MKKRLLITSIVMMLVVAVALSTATYAWFTSNASVTANSISMTAAVSDAASIGISFTNSNYGTSIAAVGAAPTGGFKPAAITTNEKYTVYSDAMWKTANVYQSGSKNYFSDVTSGDSKITTVGQASDIAYAWKDSTYSDFWINNGSTANEISNVRISATVAGEATDFIRIAVFRNNGTNFVLWGILAGDYTYTAATGKVVAETKYYDANGAEIDTSALTAGTDNVPANSFTRGSARASDTVAVGTVTKDRAVNQADATGENPAWGNDFCIKQVSASYYLDLGGLDNATANADPVINADAMQLRVVIWMDGTALNDDTAGSGKISSIALNFTATPGTYSAETFSA